MEKAQLKRVVNNAHNEQTISMVLHFDNPSRVGLWVMANPDNLVLIYLKDKFINLNNTSPLVFPSVSNIYFSIKRYDLHLAIIGFENQFVVFLRVAVYTCFTV